MSRWKWVLFCWHRQAAAKGQLSATGSLLWNVMGNLKHDTRFVLRGEVSSVPFICCCQRRWLNAWPPATSFYSILQPGVIWKKDWSDMSGLCQRFLQVGWKKSWKVSVVCCGPTKQLRCSHKLSRIPLSLVLAPLGQSCSRTMMLCHSLIPHQCCALLKTGCTFQAAQI